MLDNRLYFDCCFLISVIGILLTGYVNGVREDMMKKQENKKIAIIDKKRKEFAATRKKERGDDS